MFKNYKDEKCITGIRKQHNIMVFVGNGFDISVLEKYREDSLVSSYSKFYDFLRYKGFNEDNILYKKMREDKNKCNGKGNWSDFECSLGVLLQTSVSAEELENALKDIQSMFLLFLNEIVTPEVLLELNSDIAQNEWGKEALSGFLGDLSQEDYEKMEFPEKTYEYLMYIFLFVIFYFKSIFDDFSYLDIYQFEPHPYKTVDTNFAFYPNPNGFKKNSINEETVWSSFVMVDTIHPHGYQNIPRSLLFGIENNEYVSDKVLKRFNKSYWAQSNQKYKSYFDDVTLFIIYGMSIGETDNWWWRNSYNCLLNKESELIIYYYCDDSMEKDKVKQMFIDACKISASEEEISSIKDRIYVVLHGRGSHKKMFAIKNIEKFNIEAADECG